MQKIKCALIGSGNIGTDLIYKIQRSPVLEPVWMVGIDPQSEGLQRARDMGLKTTADGVDGLLPHVAADGIQIAFDATSAYVHAENSRKLNELGVLMIDLTPAAIGPLCVPPVNLREHADGLAPGRSQAGPTPSGGSGPGDDSYSELGQPRPACRLRRDCGQPGLQIGGTGNPRQS